MNKKIKILFFMDGIGNAGGIQEMAIKWIKNIDRAKYQIDILSYNSGKKDNYSERVAELGGKVYLIESYMHKGKLFESLKQTDNFFKEHRGYDILHAHSSSKALFIIYYARKYGIKTRILHSHTTKVINPSSMAKFAAKLFRIPTLRCATDYFACSPEAGAFMFGNRALKSGKITIIHNGIDTDEFRPDDNIRKGLKTILGVEKNFVIGNVGRFMKPKNHTFLMDVFKAVCDKDENAVLVCVGNGALEDLIKEKALTLGISNHIKFLGFRNNVNEIMQAFDVLVMPSLFEGMPVVGVEAQAVGVPCVFSDTITSSAVILPDSCRLSLNDDADKWAEKILEYKNRDRISDPYKWIAERGYDIVKATRKLESLYSEFCEKRG